jgi:hypothetical protein
VTYGICFVRLEAGRTLLQTLEAANAGFDPDSEPEPMRLTPGQRAARDRIVERLTRELGPTTCEEFLYDLTLRREGATGVVQLDYSGTSAAIYIPYHYPGRLALPVITEAYHIAALVEQETGLAGYDPQADQPTAGGDLALAAARLGGTSRWAQENLAGGHRPQQRMRDIPAHEDKQPGHARALAGAVPLPAVNRLTHPAIVLANTRPSGRRSHRTESHSLHAPARGCQSVWHQTRLWVPVAGDLALRCEYRPSNLARSEKCLPQPASPRGSD